VCAVKGPVLALAVAVCRPDLIDWTRVCLQTPRENLQLAFDIAERVYNVTRLLDPEGDYADSDGWFIDDHLSLSAPLIVSLTILRKVRADTMWDWSYHRPKRIVFIRPC